VKHHGICDLSIGQIAAEAGVCVRTVQNASAEAIRQRHLARTERPQMGGLAHIAAAARRLPPARSAKRQLTADEAIP
jgi:hypothetical protein